MNYEKRILRYDAKTGEPVYYDPKPQILVLDEKSLKYAFKWIGYDGTEKTILFQSASAIDIIVNASVSKTIPGKYLYDYKVQSLPSSKVPLTIFTVQNFATEVESSRIANIYVGKMASFINEFKTGNWISFGILPNFPTVGAGQTVNFKITSTSPPGVVECRVHGGDLSIKGVGEDMPQELENALPGYKDWPSGYTIGPVDNLKSISQPEKINYLLKSLPQCLRQGWITAQTMRTYEQLLKQKNLQGIFTRAANDLKTNSITTEVFVVIEGMRN